MKKHIVTCVDYGDFCDGKARVLGVFNTRTEAEIYVNKDMKEYVDNGTYDNESSYETIDYRGMCIYTYNRENGCEWNIEEIEIVP